MEDIENVKDPIREHSTDMGTDFFISKFTKNDISIQSGPYIKFIKVRNVKDPIREHQTDAGIDFFMPEFTEDFINDLSEKNKNNDIYIQNSPDLKYINVYPHSGILIPSGIKVILPENTALIAFNKSGIATKKQLVIGACVIDEDYRGEMHIHLINSSNEIISINENQKLTQFILLPIYYAKMIKITEDEFNNYKTDRGEGGFGSTGV